jgi:acyl-CoA synthetase (AMP-forming)/AMP-acid ligase II
MMTPSPPVTLDGLLEEKAAKLGETPFFQYQDDEYSYAELDAKANAIANELHAKGIEEGDAVCILSYNRPEYLYTIFALAKIGAIAAPIDTRFTEETLTHVLSNTDAKILILDANAKTNYETVRDEVSNITTEFFVGPPESRHPYHDFDQLLEGNESTPPDTETSGTDTCSVYYIQRYPQRNYPQAVKLPHYSYVNTGWEASQNILSLSQNDCIFTTLPFYSSYPIQMGVTGALIAEAEFAFEKQFDGDRFWEWIRTHDATVFLYLGRMLSVLRNQETTPSEDENPTEYAIGHGFGVEMDATIIDTFEERFDITVLEAYGTTATATLATSNRVNDRKLGSIGKPISSAEVRIVDENDWVVPTGDTGEIVVRPTIPNTMMQEFYDDSELTTEVCRNQWIHTNDIGYKDEDGYLYFVANKSNTIHLSRVAGRISSLEIESVIDSHPDAAESVVFGVTDDAGEQSIKAVVVPKEGTSLSPIDVSEHCEHQLTYRKLPRYVQIRTELPRSPSGKVEFDELRGTTIADGVWDRERGYELGR